MRPASLSVSVALGFALALSVAARVHAAPRTDHLDIASPTLTGGAFREDDERIFEIQGHLILAAARIGGRAEHGVNVVTANELGFYLFDDNDQAVGAAIAHRTRRGVSVQIRRIKISEAAVVHSLVGKRVTQTLAFGRGAQRDCGMSDMRDACKSTIKRTRRRTIVLGEDEVFARLVLRDDRGTIRFVLCVNAEHPAPEDEEQASNFELALLANRLAGFPFVLDAATGARLAMRCE
jgi:hypothetical protein